MNKNFILIKNITIRDKLLFIQIQFLKHKILDIDERKESFETNAKQINKTRFFIGPISSKISIQKVHQPSYKYKMILITIHKGEKNQNCSNNVIPHLFYSDNERSR